MGHDQRFKEFLQVFLQDFLKLFFPRVAERLDFGHVEFLDKEVFTELHDGSRREADVVAKLRTRGGKSELVLIHIEVQARTGPAVAERMFEYFSLFRARYRVPIFPMVVYLRRGKTGFAVEEYRLSLFDTEILKFRYESVRLARLDAEEYLDSGDPVAAGLAALMNRSARSRRQSLESLRLSMLWRVVESTLDEARQFLLVDLIQTYFPLSGREKMRYDQLISGKENRKVQDVELSWAERLREEGREAGEVVGKRKALLRLLAAKFGPLSDATTGQVEAIESGDEIDVLLTRVLTATSLDEMGL